MSNTKTSEVDEGKEVNNSPIENNKRVESTLNVLAIVATILTFVFGEWLWARILFGIAMLAFLYQNGPLREVFGRARNYTRQLSSLLEPSRRFLAQIAALLLQVIPFVFVLSVGLAFIIAINYLLPYTGLTIYTFFSPFSDRQFSDTDWMRANIIVVSSVFICALFIPLFFARANRITNEMFNSPYIQNLIDKHYKDILITIQQNWQDFSKEFKNDSEYVAACWPIAFHNGVITIAYPDALDFKKKQNPQASNFPYWPNVPLLQYEVIINNEGRTRLGKYANVPVKRIKFRRMRLRDIEQLQAMALSPTAQE